MGRLAAAAATVMLLSIPAQAGPVVCSTTYEAPLGSSEDRTLQPVEVTRCGPVQTTAELLDQRVFSYTAPFARGIDITHQFTDLLGISMGGGDGTKVMGFGFPDQTIVWDGSAIENTYRSLLEEQSSPLPRRVADLESPYSNSIRKRMPLPDAAPVRGLW